MRYEEPGCPRMQRDRDRTHGYDKIVSTSDDFICDRCRQSVDKYRKVLTEAWKDRTNLIRLGDFISSSEEPLDCAMCDLFLSLQEADNRYRSQSTHNDFMPSGGVFGRNIINWHRLNNILDCHVDNYAYWLSMGPQHTPMIMLMEGSLKSDHPRNRYCAKMIDQDKIDLGSFRHHITQCLRDHPGCTPHRERGRERKVLPSHVINCETLRVEPLTDGARYVTLSYVWGPQNHSESDTQESTVHNAPRVVKDAMEIAKGLGFVYLWVDRFCIKQDDAAHKMSQISMMDSIYENAVVTLVDAVGVNDRDGLPGAGTHPIVRREKQKCARVGNTVFVLVETDVRQALRGSKWSTRGWTYQEAMLSSRCIFFTRNQAFFVCKTTCRSESLPDLPTSIFESTGSEITLANLLVSRSLFGQSNRFDEVGDNRWLNVQINQYINRELTYHQDRLNAFVGVLARYKFNSYWGIPLMQDEHDAITLNQGNHTSHRGIKAAFLRGLCWRPEAIEGGPEGDVWSAKRNSDMPTWSWVSVTNCFIHFIPFRIKPPAKCGDVLSYRQTRKNGLGYHSSEWGSEWDFNWDGGTRISIMSFPHSSGKVRPVGQMWQDYMAKPELGKVISHDGNLIILNTLASAVVRFSIAPSENLKREDFRKSIFTIRVEIEEEDEELTSRGPEAQPNVHIDASIDCCCEFAKDFNIELESKVEQVVETNDLLIARLVPSALAYLMHGAVQYSAVYLLLQSVSKEENIWKRIGIADGLEWSLTHGDFQLRNLILS